MNPAAILALIGDLYSQVTQLTQENQALREALAATAESEQHPQPDGGADD